MKHNSNTCECFNRSLNIVRVFMAEKIDVGDVVIDATAGNGHDTLFLARLVGPTGKVYSFDVQQQAVEHTKALLEKHGASENVALIHDGHEHLDCHVSEQVQAAVFNLGYLPGGDKNIATHADNSISALEKILTLLKPGGAVFLVIYYGQPTGPEEKEGLLKFVSSLDQQQYNVSYLELINQANDPPSLLTIEKRI